MGIQKYAVDAFTGRRKWYSWLVSFNDVNQLWRDQPTYLIVQALFVLGGLITLLHAQRQGGRWPWFWLGALLHGLWADNFWHFAMPEMDNFWHSQTPIMLLGGRLPVHIVLVYPVLMYIAAYSVSRLNLSLGHEMCAAGLLTVLIDIPYDIVSIKFVHWTWHATDPNIYDRTYYVPWNSYYFHAAFAASFYLMFHLFRKWLLKGTGEKKWQSAGFKIESRALLLTALLAMPGGVIAFAVLYHPLHDTLAIPSEVTFMCLFTLFLAVTVAGLLSAETTHQVQKKEIKDKKRTPKMNYLLYALLLVYYAVFWSLTVWGSPEREVSTGLHQTVGPCQEAESLITPFGQELWKGRYLCAEQHHEEYFDFHCVGNRRPADLTSWYTICGTPFINRAEYITITTAILFFALYIFGKILLGKQPEEEESSPKKKVKTK